MSGDGDRMHAQYEAYPYPARQAADEKRRLIKGSPSNLPELNHYLFAGRRDFARPFRALSAGGGTGDGAIMLAQQLADAGSGGSVVYIDLSRRSREIAEARAAARGLGNIEFHTLSLLDPSLAGLGPFDYIDCCGVLHHLEDPLAGLRALAAMLAPGGGMGLMLYGALGRRGVYDVQAMLRSIGADAPLPERVALARRLLGALPPTNWFARNAFIGDHRQSDAELVDLLLHSRDRAFLVEEVAKLVDDANLAIAGFIEPARYEPATYIRDPVLLRSLEGLGHIERAIFAERLAGNMKRHIVYLARDEGTGAQLSPEAAPLLDGVEASSLAATLQQRGELRAELDGLTLSFAVPRSAPAIVALMDGVRTAGEIVGTLEQRGLDRSRLERDLETLFTALNGINRLFLRIPAPG